MIRRITEAPILMLTARNEVRDRIEGLRSGADDYIPKPFDLEELALRIRAAVRRPTMRDVEHVTFEDLSIDLRAHTVARGGRYLKLSAREFDLLVTLARGPSACSQRDELLIWSGETNATRRPRPSKRTSPICVRKVDAEFTHPLIHTVRGVRLHAA